MRNLFSVDLVLLSARDGKWYVCTQGGKGKASLPHVGMSRAPSDSLASSAKSLASKTVGSAPKWMTQVGAFTEGAHPADAPLSVAFVSVYPEGTGKDEEGWVRADTAQLPARQKALLKATMATLKQAVEYEPLAFHALPASFTLRELQQVYELLLERELHKASFRRSLQAARLVEPTKQWRIEGRGRPAQLFKYAPKKRKGAARGVRFEISR
jgi:8-oxo-dGTP diphosphatase